MSAERDWELYTGHRARMTAALLSTTRVEGGRLCILGAGRCNDVDLESLAASFREIHLVDRDATAVADAVARQRPDIRSRLFRHAPVDLSGLSKRLKKWKQAPPTASGLAATVEAAGRSLVGSLPGPFEVVVSACMLTQMSFHLRDSLGERYPLLGAIRTALTDIHLRTLLGLTAQAGASLFVCDLTSSTYYPLSAIRQEEELRDVMRDIVLAGKFYHAANPSVIERLLAHHARGAQADLLDPWLWTGSADRSYFVYAYRVWKALA